MIRTLKQECNILEYTRICVENKIKQCSAYYAFHICSVIIWNSCLCMSSYLVDDVGLLYAISLIDATSYFFHVKYFCRMQEWWNDYSLLLLSCNYYELTNLLPSVDIYCIYINIFAPNQAKSISSNQLLTYP